MIQFIEDQLIEYCEYETGIIDANTPIENIPISREKCILDCMLSIHPKLTKKYQMDMYTKIYDEFLLKQYAFTEYHTKYINGYREVIRLILFSHTYNHLLFPDTNTKKELTQENIELLTKILHIENFTIMSFLDAVVCISSVYEFDGFSLNSNETITIYNKNKLKYNYLESNHLQTPDIFENDYREMLMDEPPITYKYCLPYVLCGTCGLVSFQNMIKMLVLHPNIIQMPISFKLKKEVTYHPHGGELLSAYDVVTHDFEHLDYAVVNVHYLRHSKLIDKLLQYDSKSIEYKYVCFAMYVILFECLIFESSRDIDLVDDWNVPLYADRSLIKLTKEISELVKDTRHLTYEETILLDKKLQSNNFECIQSITLFEKFPLTHFRSFDARDMSCMLSLFKEHPLHSDYLSVVQPYIDDLNQIYYGSIKPNDTVRKVKGFNISNSVRLYETLLKYFEMDKYLDSMHTTKDFYSCQSLNKKLGREHLFKKLEVTTNIDVVPYEPTKSISENILLHFKYENRESDLYGGPPVDDFDKEDAYIIEADPELYILSNKHIFYVLDEYVFQFNKILRIIESVLFILSRQFLVDINPFNKT